MPLYVMNWRLSPPTPGAQSLTELAAFSLVPGRDRRGCAGCLLCKSLHTGGQELFRIGNDNAGNPAVEGE